MIYYIADMHFGHTNVLRFDNRPFSDTAQMDDTLIQNWNERVATDDTVYVLGDAFWKNEENSIRIIQQLNGHKHLIQGNHDRVKGKLRFYCNRCINEVRRGGHLCPPLRNFRKSFDFA